jgi:hypothetical protein
MAEAELEDYSADCAGMNEVAIAAVLLPEDSSVAKPPYRIPIESARAAQTS